MKTIDQVIAEKLSNFYVGEWPIGNLILCIIALFLSAILCGIIGFERERRGRTAGLRTHLLVGLGSCIIMIISIYGFPTIYQDGTPLNRDIARLAAQVIAGVGFLGAGAIIHRNDGIKGLTTAATIWVVMAIGLACGSMNFILATGSTLIIFLFLTAFRTFESKIKKNAVWVVIHADKNKPVLAKITEVTKSFDCDISDLRFETNDSGNLEISFKSQANTKSFSELDFITKLNEIDGVIDVGTLNAH